MSQKISFSSLRSSAIPFSVYLNSYTILSKNNDVMQTIKVISHRKTDSLKDKIRSLLKSAVRDSFDIVQQNEISFWMHDIRFNNYEISKFNQDLYTEPEQPFLEFFDKTIKNKFKKLKYHSTELYLTLSIRPKVRSAVIYKIASVFGLDLFSGRTLRRVIESEAVLSNASKKIIDTLNKNNIESSRLGIIKANDGNYYSEHIKFFNQISGISMSRLSRVPIAYLDKTIKSKFSFEFGMLYSKYQENSENIFRYSTFFTIKDDNYLNGRIIDALLSQVNDATLVEIDHPCEFKDVKSRYKKSYEEMRTDYDSWDNYDIQEYSKLGQVMKDTDEDGKPKQFYKQYMGVALYSDSYAGLESDIAGFVDAAKSLGVHVAREDIGTERAFYSYFPGNYSYIKHYNLVDIDSLFSLSFAYSFDNNNLLSYIKESPIATLSTINQNAYAFGIVKDSPDILISAKSTRYSGTMINYLVLASRIRYKNVNIYQIDLGNQSQTLNRMCLGKCYSKRRSSNPMSILKNDNFSQEEYNNFITGIISLIILDDNLATEIAKKALSRSSDGVRIIEYIVDIARGTKYAKEIKDFFYPEGENQVILTDEPAQIEGERDFMTTSLNLDKETKRGPIGRVLCLVSLYDFYGRLVVNKNPSVVSISRVNYIMKNKFMSAIFRKMLALSRNKVYFIMGLNHYQDNEHWHMSIEELMKFCTTEIHNFDIDFSKEYADFFKLKEVEERAFKKMLQINNSCMLKQNGLVVAMTNSIIKKFNMVLSEIISDNIDIRNKIDEIKESLDIENESDLIFTVLNYSETGNLEKTSSSKDMTHEQQEQMVKRKERAERIAKLEEYASEIIDAS